MALPIGTSSNEVKRILGEPAMVDATVWRYSRKMMWCIVEVKFDTNGAFASFEIDR